MNKQVVIIGQVPDVHIETVVALLQSKGVTAWVFDRFNPAHLVTLATAARASGHFRFADRVVPFESVDAVWWRWKPLANGEWTGAFGNVAEGFVSQEWRVVLRAPPFYLSQAAWLNPLEAHQRASSKPWQLAIAPQVGLRVPASLFTNDPETITRLFERHGRLVYKTISSFIVPPDEIIYTNEITKEDVEVSLCNIRRAPGIFQQLVEKAREAASLSLGTRSSPFVSTHSGRSRQAALPGAH